ncbi:MAG: type IV secretory system conjugative DNA transfer family protein, partial [Chloroflexota bacterium]|nr:type IV secretory system conjugative DNA transfer family protein [Chloroflexota bacterium]
VMCYMDEFGVMGKIPSFEARLATVRGYGIGCLMVVQSKSQIDAQYGEDASKSILQNANTKMCLSRVTGEDARMFSELAGHTTVITTSQNDTRRTFDVLRQYGGHSRTETQRALITPDELRTMGDDVFAVLAGEHAIRAKQRPYYKDRTLRRLVPDLEKTDVLASLRRQYPLADPGLGAEIPDQAEVEDAIETQRAEGAYVKSGEAPPQPVPTMANGNRYSARNTAVRSATRIRVIERHRPSTTTVSSASDVDPEHDQGEAATPPPRPTNGTITPQPDGAAMLQEPHARVLELLAEGKTISQIATELGYKHQTVKNYLNTIYSRLGVQTRGDEGRRDAVAIARERHVISQDVERSGDQEH